MGATSIFGFPYPAVGDAPNTPLHLQLLAEAVETTLNGSYKTDRDAAIAAAVTSLLSAEAGYAEVLTGETTATFASFVDLATVGPSVTLTSQGTRALCLFGYEGSSGASNGGVFASPAVVTGGTTTAASNDWQAGSDKDFFAGVGFKLFTITPGSNTYRLRYRVNANTGTFSRRRLWVLAP